tara:strand:- start:1480 stop:2640 length:1161 start_codon:yes stop_codon:yes gene_type:complete
MAGNSSGGTLLATVVTIVILLGGINYITGGMVASTLFPDGTGPAATGVYSGSVTPSVSHVDAINPTTTYTGGQDVTLSWLSCAGCNGVGEYTNIGKKGNQSFVLSPSDNGKAYAELLNSGASADVYLSYYKTYQANQGILESIVFTDYDGDTTKEHVAKFNTNQLAAQATQLGGGSSLDMPVTVAWYKKASTISGQIQEPGATRIHGAANGLGGFACDAPSASTPCLTNMAGAVNETKFIYRFTMDDFDKIVLLNQVWLQINQTDDGTWQEDSIKLDIAFYDPRTGTAGPETRYVVGELGSELQTSSSNSTYKWTFAEDLSSIQNPNTILYTKTGENKYVDITLTIKWELGATDKTNVGLKLVYFDDTGVKQNSLAGRMVYGGAGS